MAAIQEYKCPSCGGAIAFDSTIQKLKCPFCDTVFDMETLASYDSELKNDLEDDMSWQMDSKDGWQEDELDGLKVYVCQSCGGEITCDENTAATSCPFCGNPVIMMGRLSGALKPDFVIPFKVNKKAAKEAIKKYYEGKRLLPRVFKTQNHINEVKGVYVPFWLFDTGASVNMRYKATKVRTWKDNEYDYIETKYYAVRRDGKINFEMVPVDGSAKMPNDLMESLEPFDFSDLVDFQTAYLAGYLADKYDMDSERSVERANERIRKSAEDAFSRTVKGYVTVTKEAGSIQLQNGRVSYALFPVWILSTTWNGQSYLFAMNGQTGKMVGDLPLDKAEYKKCLFGMTGMIGVALFSILFLLWVL